MNFIDIQERLPEEDEDDKLYWVILQKRENELRILQISMFKDGEFINVNHDSVTHWQYFDKILD